MPCRRGLVRRGTDPERQWLRVRQRNAYATLVAYAGVQVERNDPRYARDDVFDAISQNLVARAHEWARRGYRIANELRQSDAIGPGDAARIEEVLDRCAAEKERMHLLRQGLPHLSIIAVTDRQREARRQWEELCHDGRTLRRYVTRTFWIAYFDPDSPSF